MAKFKKKRSEPTPDPERESAASQDKTGEKQDEAAAPETGEPGPAVGEGGEKGGEAPPTEPEPEAAGGPRPGDDINIGGSEKDRKLNQLFWLRVALAIAAGTAATFIFEGIEGPEDRRWASIGFMIVVFFATIIVAKGMRMQLPSADRKKIVTQAIGSYVFLYLFTWIVTYTLVWSGSTPVGVNI